MSKKGPTKKPWYARIIPSRASRRGKQTQAKPIASTSTAATSSAVADPFDNLFPADKNGIAPWPVDATGKDMSIEEWLSEPKRAAMFHAFLETEFSSENTEFLKEISEFNQKVIQGEQDIEARLNEFYAIFIEKSADKRINLTGNQFEKADEAFKLESGAAQEKMEALIEPEKNVLALIGRDSFTRFTAIMRDKKQRQALINKKDPLGKENVAGFGVFSAYMKEYVELIQKHNIEKGKSATLESGKPKMGAKAKTPFAGTVAAYERGLRVEVPARGPGPETATTIHSPPTSPVPQGQGRPQPITPSGGATSSSSSSTRTKPPLKREPSPVREEEFAKTTENNPRRPGPGGKTG